MSLAKRVAALEAAAIPQTPFIPQTWHLVPQFEGQTFADAVRAFGLDNIGEHDDLIILLGVEPKFDEDGVMIPPPEPEPLYGDWRDLCGVRWGDRDGVPGWIDCGPGEGGDPHE